jgi:hypothetical protein
MLYGLSKIDWEQYGAGEFPKWVLDLRSNEFQVRLKAGFKLSAYFCQHSYSLNVISEIEELLSTDAPVLTVPFLLELLAVDDIDNKRIVLELLHTVSEFFEITRLNETQLERAQAIH